MNQGWCYTDQITNADIGLTILDYYAQRYRHSTQAEWRDRIQSGQVLLNGSPATAHTRLQAGQHLAYQRPPWEEPAVPLNFDILHADADVLVVAKPAGLPVLPGGGFLEHTLLGQLKRQYPQDTPTPIHRLGRGTSGLVLLARSSAARANLSQQMRDRSIRKIYRALVGCGALPDRFTVTQPIGKVFHPVLGHVYAATAHGLAAHSECRVLRRNADTTLLEVTILTGRSHQIRIHLAAAGFPLLGDPFYAVGGIPHLFDSSQNIAVPGDCGYRLHAHHLSFSHPQTKQPVHVTCPAPNELN